MPPPIEVRRRDAAGGLEPPATLRSRYSPDDLSLLSEDELRRLLPSDAKSWDEVATALAWELLYRKEPALYERLIAGEKLHPEIFEWLPQSVSRAVDIGAGSGRLTLPLSQRCRELLAIEPASPMRELLGSRLENHRIHNVRVVTGFFDSLPVPDEWSELTISCSSFTTHESHGGEQGLEEMDRVTRRGGLVVIVWPVETDWLERHGFETVTFKGESEVEFTSVEEAVEVGEIFYPWAVSRIKAENMRSVPYDLLEMPPPNTLCWKEKL